MSDYPWYSQVSGDSIEQGDILEGVRLLVLPDSIPDDGSEVAVNWIRQTVIVMSQSCDLVVGREKVPEVLLCEVWPLDELGGHLSTPKGKEDARRGNLPSIHLLNGVDLPDFSAGPQVVDFRRVHTLPIDHFRKLCTAVDARVRLMPPYREHLSQAFARFFMRVGLPVDIPPFK